MVMTADDDVNQKFGGKKNNIVSLKDKIALGPIDRYKKYNKFPWKLIMHFMLIAITSLQVITLV